jgi:ComF family protein
MLSESRSRTSPPPAQSPRNLRPLTAVADCLIAVLVAPACAACDIPLASPTSGAVCASCWNAIDTFPPPWCERCGDALPSWRVVSVASATCARCRRRGSALSRARALGPYDGALRRIVQALKYGRRPTVARRLAQLLAGAHGDLLSGVELAVPVPLHRGRHRQRGFNQAEELARHLGVPWARVLRRTRATPSQTGLPAARRHANVRGAFSMRRRTYVDGLCVLLVDDVCTTGATLESCARVLRQAGAREVRAITAARVAGPGR